MNLNPALTPGLRRLLQEEAQDRKTRWGRAALEAVAGIALGMALSSALGWTWEALEWSTLVVAALAARSGFGPGLIAGIVAMAPRLWLGGFAPGAFLDVTASRSGLAQAFAPVILGGLVGLVGEAHRQAQARIRLDLNVTNEKLEDTEHRLQLVTAAKEAQDRRIVGQAQTLGALYDAARHLDVLDTDAVAPAALKLVERFVEAEAASLYLKGDGGLRLMAAYGDAPARPEAASAETGVLGEVVQTRQGYAVHSQGDFAREPILLAVPILAGGGVRGVLVVEQLPFVRLTVVTSQLLEIIADWTGRALGNAEAFVSAREAQFVDPASGIHRTRYTLERLHQEWALARRYTLPLSVVLVRSREIARTPEDGRQALVVTVARELHGRVRNIDLVGHYRSSDTFLLILPVTPSEGAAILAERLAKELPGDLAVAVGGNGGGETPEVVLQALQQSLFAEV